MKSGVGTSTAEAELLGRPVEFVRYNEQGNTDNVPRIYERLIDEDTA
ncbi:hypothetical protein [Streptomyces sp. IB201691-2A2]|nr:hypothetical protein [Streptomyces sp. IB201691-2A2]